MNSKKYYDYISKNLNTVSSIIKSNNGQNLQDLNIHAEDFFMVVLNILYDLQLKNLNEERKNSKGIDLIDKSNKIAFQLSSNNKNKKIKESFLKFKETEYKNFKFKFLHIGNSSNVKKEDFEEFNFKTDFYDIQRILNDIQHADIKVQEQIFGYFKSEFEHQSKKYRQLEIFAKPNNYEEIKDNLKSKHCIILIGEAGIGKTTVARKLICDIYTEELIFHIEDKNDINNLKSFIYSDKEFIYFLEDPWGKYSEASCLHSISDLKDLINEIETLKTKNNIYLIITSRDNIMDSDNKNDFSDYIFRITKEDYSNKEKERIIDYQIDNEEIYEKKYIINKYKKNILSENLSPYSLVNLIKLLKNHQEKENIHFDSLLKKCKELSKLFKNELKEASDEEKNACIILWLELMSRNTISEKNLVEISKSISTLNIKIDLNKALNHWLLKNKWAKKQENYYSIHPIALEEMENNIKHDIILSQTVFDFLIENYYEKLENRNILYNIVKIIKNFSMNISDNIQNRVNEYILTELINKDGRDFEVFFLNTNSFLDGDDPNIKLIKWLYGKKIKRPTNSSPFFYRGSGELCKIWEKIDLKEDEIELIKKSDSSKIIMEKFLKNCFLNYDRWDTGNNIIDFIKRIGWDFSDFFSEKFSELEILTDGNVSYYRILNGYRLYDTTEDSYKDILNGLLGSTIAIDKKYEFYKEEIYKHEQGEISGYDYDYDESEESNNNLNDQIDKYIEHYGIKWIIDYIKSPKNCYYFLDSIKNYFSKPNHNGKEDVELIYVKEILDELEKIVVDKDKKKLYLTSLEAITTFYANYYDYSFLKELSRKFNSIVIFADFIELLVEKIKNKKNFLDNHHLFIELLPNEIIECLNHNENLKSLDINIPKINILSVEDLEKIALYSLTEIKLHALSSLFEINYIDKDFIKKVLYTKSDLDSYDRFFRPYIYCLIAEKLNSITAIGLIKNGLNDKNYQVRLLCINLLENKYNKFSKKLIRKMSKDKSGYIRKEIAKIIGEHKIKDMIDILIRFLNDHWYHKDNDNYKPDYELVYEAAKSLNNFKYVKKEFTEHIEKKLINRKDIDEDTIFELIQVLYKSNSKLFYSICWKYLQMDYSENLKENIICHLLNYCNKKKNKDRFSLKDSERKLLFKFILHQNNNLAHFATIYICLASKEIDDLLERILDDYYKEDKLVIIYIFNYTFNLKFESSIEKYIDTIKEHPIYLLHKIKEVHSEITECIWNKIRKEKKGIENIIINYKNYSYISYIFSKRELKLLKLID